MKKGQWIRKKRHAVPLGVCFEPLEPRLLLSGSWGAGVEAPSHDSHTSIHGGFTQETVLISEITVGSGTDALNQNQTAQGPGALVDVLAQAPVLNAVNADDPALEEPSTSDQAAPATDNPSANGTGLDSDMQPERMAAAGTRELVFVNENIADYQQLIADLKGGNDNRVIEVVVLDADRDGIEQVSEIMADRSDLAAVHFITHGTDGQINLGNTWLNRVTLQQNRAAVNGWGDALSETGDIIFYGCNVAADSAGQLLLNDIADFTGADVAASNDLTGNTTSGGDWEMEYTNGEIDTDAAFSPDARQHWSGVLATFNVTTTTDGGAGSLRKAIIDANALPGADTIILPAGTYQLSLNGDKEDAAASGDLDITDDLIISGAGAKATFIDGMAADRVFEVLGSTVTISGITIQNGSEDDGGGINLDSSSNLTLRDAAVSGNHATDTGGGIGVSGVLTIECVTIEGNSADVGGGIYLNNGSSATLLNATLSGNSAAHDGGAIYTKSVADITNSTIAYNTAGGAGGIHKQGSGNASLKNTILADNTGGNSNGALISLGNNIDSQNTAGLDMLLGDQVMTDPLLGGLVYNGGPTKTHALLSGSPAIDAGTSSGAPAFDQRGYARDLAPDIGAFEFSAVAGPPVAFNDAAVTTENTPVIIDVTANDVDAEGDPLSVFDYTLPANGTLADNGDGTITYTPDAAFTGSDNFEYVVTDGNDGTSHYWKLDGDGVDSAGSNDATPITGTATIVGHYGSALRFDEFDDKVVIPDFSYASDFTVSLRFRVDDNTGNAFQYIYSHGVADAPQSLNIYIGENLCAYPNMLLTNLRDANDNMDGTALNVDLAALGIIGDGQWHLYTLTVTAGVGSEVFIDGVSRSSSARGKDAFSPGGTDLYLGARNDLDADRFYGGGLDSVQIFDRALNGPEINALHTGGVSRATVDVTVVSNISPSIAGTTTGQAVDDNATVMPFSTVTIADDGNVGITVTLSDGDDNGSFTAASLTASGFTKTDVGEYSLGSTTPAAAQTAIRLLVFDPTENQVAPGATVTTTFTIDVDDGFLSSADSTTTVIATSINFAPTADPGGPYTISEGGALNLDASASDDPDGTIVSWDWDIGDNGSFEKSGEIVSYTWAELNAAGVIDDGPADVTLRVTDNDGAQTFQTFQVTVDNTAPTLVVSGDTTVDDGALYTLNLSATDPGDDAITSWTINWGDGTIETIPGNPSSATHIYSNAGFTYNILVSATDEDSTANYIHNDLFAGHYINDAGVYRIQGDWGAAPVEFANEGTLDKTIQPIIGPDGNLYVSGESSRNVLRYNTETGAFIDVFANIPGDAGGIAFGPDGNLYVADYTDREILRFNGSDGSAMGAFATGIGGRPYSLAFGPDGNLYVALYDNAEVLKYDGLSGTALGTFISAGAGGLGTPEQILFGPDGNLYIADVANNSVLRFNGTDGTPMGDFVADSEPHLDEPNGLAFGPDGNLYVSDSQHGVILRFDGSTGVFIDEYASGLDEPSLLAFAPDLQVHVTANAPPTLSSFIAPVTSGDEDSEITVTFGDLAAQGDENDADGTVEAFVVKAVTSGTLRIGADAGSATAWVADSNDTLNATTHAYWTPDPHANGTLDAFEVVAQDDDGAQSSTSVTAQVIVNPINDAPTISAIANQTIAEDTTTGPLTFTVSDAETGASSLLVTAASDNTALIPNGNLTLVDLGSGNWTIEAAPAANQNGGPVTITVTVDDGTATTDETFTVTVTAANDAPAIAVPATQSMREGATLVFSAANGNAISVGDLDAGASIVQVTLAAANGTLNLSGTAGLTFVSGTGTGDASMSFTGTLTSVNAALNGLGFTATPNAAGGANLDISVDDLGNTGAGGAHSASAAVPINVAGFFISPTSGLLTGEGGGTASFNVVLRSVPTAAVAVAISSSDTSEGTVSVGSLTFTTANWNVPQMVTVTGVDDFIIDGDVGYNVITGAAASSDGGYGGLNPVDVSLTNVDNSFPSITVNPTSGLVTTEAGGTAQFSVVLATQPFFNVVIPVSSSDTGEGTVSVSSLTFTAGNWLVPQVVTVTGVNDFLNDGNVGYTIILGPATSFDLNYNGHNPADVSVNNQAVPNAPPVNTVPGPQSTLEDTALIFSTANSNAISVADPDAGTNPLQLSLSVTTGRLTLASVAGLTFNSGANGTDSMTVTGTAAQINAALNGLQYVPNANTYGPDVLAITTNDLGNTGTGGARSDSSLVAINVLTVNDAPTTSPVALAAIAEDSGVRTITQVELLANASDIEGDSLTAMGLAISAGNGALVDNGDGTWDYTPAADDDTSVSFTYTITDGSDTVGGSATLDITPVNDAPTTSPVTLVAIGEDSGARTITQAELLANASDLEGDSLTATGLAISAGNGTLLDNGDGTWDYTPAADDDMSVSFTYTITDGSDTVGGSATMDITPVNDAPVASDDSASTNEDTPVTFNVVSNDTDVEGDALTVSAVTQGANGAVTFAGSTVTYTPNANFNGSDSFTYTVSDGNGGTDTATVDVTVNPINDAPTASGTYSMPSTDENTNSAAVQVSAILADASITASDPDGDTLGIAVIAKTGLGIWEYSTDGVGGWSVFGAVNSNAAVLLSPTTWVRYVPDGENGESAGFDFRAWDQTTDLASVNGTPRFGDTVPGGGTRAYSNGSASVALIVSAINDAPVAADDSASTNEDTPVTVNVVSNDTDVEGDALTVSAVTQGSNGAVTFAGGTVTYTPNANFNGSDSFTYTVSDGNGGTDTATVTVIVNPVNNAPTASNLNAAETYTEDIPLNLADIVIADVDSAAVTVSLTLSDPAAGSLSTGTSGAVTATYSGGVWTASGPIADVNALLAGVVFTPSANYDGSFAIAVSIDDGVAAPVTGIKIVTGTPVGDTPQVGSIATPATVQSDLIVIDRNAGDGAEVTHFRIADITNGTLYLADGISPIHDGDYITVAQGQAGVRFTPAADTLSDGSFTVESSEDGVSVAQQSGAAISVITVIPPPTSPTVTIPSGNGDTVGPGPDTAPEASEPAAEPEPAPEKDVPEAVAPPANRSPAEESVPQHRGLTTAPMPVLAQAVRYISQMRAAGVDLRDIAERLSDNVGSSQKAAASDPGPQRAEMQAGVHNLISARAYLNMVNSFNAVKKEMADDNQLNRVYLGSAIVSSIGLSVGYVVWLIRGGLLLSSLLSSLPAWQILDPLPILARKKGDDHSEDDESLESILDRKPPEPKPKKESADASSDAEEKKR